MRIVLDIEANGLDNPTKIWVIVCKDIDTGEYHIFRENDYEAFKKFWEKISSVIGHNVLGYDLPVLSNLVGIDFNPSYPATVDTLIVSRLADYPRKGHGLADYGEEFGLPKIEFSDFDKYSKEMEDYCVRDVDITHLVYNHYADFLASVSQHVALSTEQEFQLVCNDLRSNGFCFDRARAETYLRKVEDELKVLDEDIRQFPARFKFIREVTPKATKFGTISQTSIPKALRGQTHELTPEASFSYGEWVQFNPDSIKQQVDLLWSAGWKPTDKTKTHLRNREVVKEEKLARYGWKVNEINLATLPAKAPPAAKTLAKRILYESRRRTLSEWLSLASNEGRIHGKFQSIGAWTHRMAHQAPNMANIPNATDLAGNTRLLGAEMRSLFIAGRNRLLVGTDAKGIQLRIFAHYIDDKEFTHAVTQGDPHSLNKTIMGDVCKTRAASKRFIFAMLLGAGLGKLAEILECSREQAGLALARIMERYDGFRILKKTIIPKDAQLGFFVGLDGRKVKIPGDTVSKREHLAMSGYLQNGEAVAMKRATLKWLQGLGPLLEEYKHTYGFTLPKLVNLVHDEWQTECINDKHLAIKIGQLQDKALQEVGNELLLKCPLAGSFWNDDRGDYTIGTNWKITH